MVILDGGINDIGVNEIVSPLASSNLEQLAIQLCRDRMVTLLLEITQKFPNAPVALCGYYRIATDDSDISKLVLLLSGPGLLVGGLAGAIVGGVITRSK